jgi:hypothetical protein
MEIFCRWPLPRRESVSISQICSRTGTGPLGVEIIGVRIDEETSPVWRITCLVDGRRHVHKVSRADAENLEEAERIAASELSAARADLGD